MADRFQRDRLPDAVSFFEGQGLVLKGRGAWRTTRCEFHGGSDSMRVNTKTGGWCCMACGARGGDVVGYLMARDGTEFVDAARALGCWDESGTDTGRPRTRATTLPARQAMEVIAMEATVAMVVMSDARSGIEVREADWNRFVQAVGRINALATEYAS